jgi:aldehyde:ferredoxin oxidoreductase
MLKAILAFRGSGRIEVHNPQALLKISQEMYEDVEYFRGTIGGVETMFKAGSGALPIKNYSTYNWEASDKEVQSFSEMSIREKYQTNRMPCWSCRLLHSTMMEIPDGKYSCQVEEPEYEQMAAWGPVIGQSNVEAAMMLSGLTDRLGLENNEAGWLVAWVMECMEKRYLTTERVGLFTKFGDVEGAEKILRMTSERKDFGDILAEGVKKASEIIGGQAAEIAIYTMKGNTPRGHDHRSRWAEMFDTCVSNTGTIETHMSVMSPDAQGNKNPLLISNEVARTKGLMQLEDSVGTCRFNTRMNNVKIAEAISAATGWDMSPEEAKEIGRRAVNLLRVFNIQTGIRKEFDRPSNRYGSTPVDGPAKGISIIPHWDQMLENYYEQMGWSPETGAPLPETLKSLSLPHVAKDVDSL